MPKPKEGGRMTIHKQCNLCGNLGHKVDMVFNRFVDYGGTSCGEWYHPKCYEQNFKVTKCSCGKGWIKCRTKRN